MKYTGSFFAILFSSALVFNAVAKEKQKSKEPASESFTIEGLKTKNPEEYAKILSGLLKNVESLARQCAREESLDLKKQKLEKVFQKMNELYKFDNAYDSVGYLVPIRDRNKKLFFEVLSKQSQELQDYIKEGLQLIDEDAPNG